MAVFEIILARRAPRLAPLVVRKQFRHKIRTVRKKRGVENGR
jgi:hypothetical protein